MRQQSRVRRVVSFCQEKCPVPRRSSSMPLIRSVALNTAKVHVESVQRQPNFPVLSRKLEILSVHYSGWTSVGLFLSNFQNKNQTTYRNEGKESISKLFTIDKHNVMKTDFFDFEFP